MVWVRERESADKPVQGHQPSGLRRAGRDRLHEEVQQRRGDSRLFQGRARQVLLQPGVHVHYYPGLACDDLSSSADQVSSTLIKPEMNILTRIFQKKKNFYFVFFKNI